MKQGIVTQYNLRYRALMLGVITLACLLLARLLDLAFMQGDFLRSQGKKRFMRTVEFSSPRGIIKDRNGEALAISTKVKSLWVEPQEFYISSDKLQKLASLLNVKEEALQARIQHNSSKKFLYLKRHLLPAVATEIENLAIPGLYFNTEYRRYYPTGEVSAHVLGFTNIEDSGQEGLEKAYNSVLLTKPGKKRVVKDLHGREVDNVEHIAAPTDSQDITLSLDQRLQYVCFRQLKQAIDRYKAESGSVVMLDVATSEVLAMVNYPSFNPNIRDKDMQHEIYRNRAVTDHFEPASSMKPFSLVSFLENLPVNANTMINTGSGKLRLKGGIVRDDISNLGVIDLKTVLAKSSNVGTSKLALNLPNGALTDTYSRFGFGYVSGSGFPGESEGILSGYTRSEFELATQSFGYGVAVTPLQLARAYAILGSGGIRRDVSFVKQNGYVPGYRVMSKEVARETIRMLAEAIDNSILSKAKVAGYHVAGKTGTARKLGKDGYEKGKHRAVFAGLAPAIDSRFAIVVTVNEPDESAFYGNQVAAPVFSKVASQALRLYNVSPDLLETQGIYLAQNNSNHS